MFSSFTQLVAYEIVFLGIVYLLYKYAIDMINVFIAHIFSGL